MDSTNYLTLRVYLRRTAGVGGLCVGKPELLDAKAIDEGVDHPYRVLGGDVVINGFGKEGDLIAGLTLNVSH